MNDTDAKSPIDGRHLRSQLSRDNIVTAMLELIEAGAISPSAEDVAARARVGLRSVFRHFKDMESLRREMLNRLAKDYAFWLVPFTSTDMRGQLNETVQRRLTSYERLMPFKRAADAHRHQSEIVQIEYDRVIKMMRARLWSVVENMIGDDISQFEMLDLILSFEAWQRLRTEQKLDAEQAKLMIETQVENLFLVKTK